uniref:DNA damage-inducible transcript 3 protein n=1 Tax=Denticeps clupeoides TaxID=299321 RepID=A0AAY4EX91_9TELE
MTAEWLHLPPPYPPGVGPLCGAELEAWYEDLQDILGSDAGGAKHVRAPPCSEKEPEFLDVLESCPLTWLTDGQVWGEGVQRVMEEPNPQPPSQHPASCLSPPTEDERRGAGAGEGRGSGGDLLPPEFFELLGGVGLVESGVVMVSSTAGSNSHHPHQNPPSPNSSEEELPTVPDSSSCSSSSSASHASVPTVSSSRLGKRKRGGERGNSASPASSAKKSRREREQENERKVQELTDQNERLKAEIERLGEEVQRTRRALIERLVNTRK